MASVPPLVLNVAEATLAKLDLKPGDVGVLCFPQHLGQHEKQVVAETWEGWFPGVRLLILEGGSTLTVLSQKAADDFERQYAEMLASPWANEHFVVVDKDKL